MCWLMSVFVQGLAWQSPAPTSAAQLRGQHNHVCRKHCQQESWCSPGLHGALHPARLVLCMGTVMQQMKWFYRKDTAAFQKVENAFSELLSYTFQTPKLHKSPEKMQVSQREILEPLQTFCQ